MPKPKRLVVLDFDSTLFDIISFILALPIAAERTFGVNHLVYKNELQDHYVRENGQSVGYDIYAHLMAYGQDLRDDKTRQRFIDGILAVHRELTGQPDLMFPDAREMIGRLNNPHNHIVIMTMNVVSSFEFKRSLCGGHLNDIECRVVRSNKGVIMAAEWDNDIIHDGQVFETALVIDDGPSQIEEVPAEDPIKRVQVFRQGQRYPRTTDPTITVVDSLDLIH